jgi:hypothetical protein
MPCSRVYELTAGVPRGGPPRPAVPWAFVPAPGPDGTGTGAGRASGAVSFRCRLVGAAVFVTQPADRRVSEVPVLGTGVEVRQNPLRVAPVREHEMDGSRRHLVD